MNILKLVPPPPAADESSPKEPSPADKRKAQEKPWLVSLKNLSVDNYTIRVEDQTTSEPVTITAKNLKVKAENVSTARNSKGKLSLSLLLNEKGSISTTGTIGIEPMTADLKTELKGIEITSFQPYFTDKVNIAVTGGAISAAGDLSFASTEKKEIKASYKGEAALSNFSSVDKGGGDLLKFESLSFNGLNFGYAPPSIDIKGISLTDFYARVSVDPQGKVNLQEIMKKEEPKSGAPPPSIQKEKAESSPEEQEASRNIKIGQVTLQGGKIDVLDKSVKPEFSMSLSEIGGRVSELSAEANTTADVELRGKLNQYTPLEVTGKINPLREDLFVDIKARIKDLELSPATPYAGKYVGYTIEKGKLSFDLKYLIVKRKLESQNSIFFDQFTFGEKVESPTATKLPVKLAVALLKDRKGEIRLDLPVTGSLDDPKFSVWGVILKILVNLISKAATSPFSLLGAAMGGGEELSYVEFDYGRTVLTEASAKKLETIAKALRDRPALKMDVEGHVDLEKDKDGLKQYFFNNKLRVQKLNELVKKGQPSIPVDEVKIEKQEYERYLKMAYKEEKFPKPKNFIGMAKDLPAPEMEKLILTHIEVKEGDLRTLASQRSMKVKDAILKSGQVEPERVFILEPKSLAPAKKEKIKDSRVEFKLK
jgi:flagellar motor protein MotB